MFQIENVILLNYVHRQVVEIISSAIGDMTKAEFSRLRDRHGNGVIPDGGATMEDWEHQTFLSSGSLIAKGCQSAMILARHPRHLQDVAFEFGKQIAYAYQV